MAKTAFTLHGIALSGPTYKVALMFALCSERFSYRHINLREGAHKTPEFLAINRYGQVPALSHGDLKLCQSAAILEYLSEVLGKFGGATRCLASAAANGCSGMPTASAPASSGPAPSIAAS